MDCGRVVFAKLCVGISMQKTVREVELPITVILEYCEPELVTGVRKDQNMTGFA